MREAFEAHRQVIEWNVRFSEDRIPEEAVGVDPLTRRLMRWVMQSWPRVEFFNTWLAGTLRPGLCGAFRGRRGSGTRIDRRLRCCWASHAALLVGGGEAWPVASAGDDPRDL